MARAIRSKKKIAICSNGFGYLFEKKKCHLFEWLGLKKKLSSVRTACAIRSNGYGYPFKRLKLSVQRQILAKFPSQNNFFASHLCRTSGHIMKFVYKCIVNTAMDLCSFVAIFAFILSLCNLQGQNTRTKNPRKSLNTVCNIKRTRRK